MPLEHEQYPFWSVLDISMVEADLGIRVCGSSEFWVALCCAVRPFLNGAFNGDNQGRCYAIGNQ